MALPNYMGLSDPRFPGGVPVSEIGYQKGMFIPPGSLGNEPGWREYYLANVNTPYVQLETNWPKFREAYSKSQGHLTATQFMSGLSNTATQTPSSALPIAQAPAASSNTAPSQPNQPKTAPELAVNTARVTPIVIVGSAGTAPATSVLPNANDIIAASRADITSNQGTKTVAAMNLATSTVQGGTSDIKLTGIPTRAPAGAVNLGPSQQSSNDLNTIALSPRSGGMPTEPPRLVAAKKIDESGGGLSLWLLAAGVVAVLALTGGL